MEHGHGQLQEGKRKEGGRARGQEGGTMDGRTPEGAARAPVAPASFNSIIGLSEQMKKV